MQKENKELEYIESLSKTYLKMVSAFANYNDGEIVFAAKNNLKIIGIDNPLAMCLSIENQINDSIKPTPDYTLKVNDDKTISLFIKKGQYTPYRYNGKAYKRNGSSTIEVDEIEEKRLVILGMNIPFEILPSNEQNLEFNYLKTKLFKELDLESFSLDTLKSLSLYNLKTGYNNAAKLLADKNNFPGLNIVIFGNSINIIKKRIDLTGESIIKQYYDSLEIFKDEYIVEKTDDGFRKKSGINSF